MSLPELPKEWAWEAHVDADSLTLEIRHKDGVSLAKRTIPCNNPAQWETRIEGLADVMWDDMNAAAQLGAKMGLLVIYE